ncbi:hypothetical protein CYY_003298, partial [Polysphondylium violaceum]
MKTSLFIYFFLSLSILCAAGAPVITLLYPSWGSMTGNIYLKGTGFGATTALNTVTANGYPCVIQTASTTDIKCSMNTILGPIALSITVTVGGVTSNSKTYGVVEITKHSQTNNVYSIQGDFKSIPNPDQIVVKSPDQTITIPVTWSAISLTWNITKEMMAKGAFQLIDTSTNYNIGTTTTGYGPVIQDVKFYESSIVFTGFIFSGTTKVTSTQTMGQTDNCVITSWTETTLACTPVSTYFIDKYFLPYVITQANGYSTSMGSYLPNINVVQYIGTDRSNLVLTASMSQSTNIRVLGLTASPITPNSASLTSIGFTYPANAQCGNAFISTDDSLNYQRLSNSGLVCPTPLIQSVITKPDITNNYYLTFSGKYLSNQQYKTGTTTLYYKIQFGGGSTQDCSMISTLPDTNYVYTVVCQIPAITKPPTFKLVATTTKGQTSNILVGFQPTIETISKTNYRQRSVVTITGSAFSSFDLIVTIGGSQCQSPVVPEDGTQITCTFNSDVFVVDFSKPLEVVVSISSTYIDKKSIFYYNRPDPIISTSTSTNYGVPGTVTITGTYLYSTNLVVTIGGSSCTSPLSAPDGNSITCQFGSDVTVTNIRDKLEVSVIIDSTYNVKNSIFSYTLIAPTIVSSTSTMYETPGLVTITGTSFYNFGLIVTIGGATCATPVAQNDKQITCQFPSSVTITDIKNPLEISVTINSVAVKKSVFYYTLPTPTITSTTSTEYGKTGTVTITGTNFYGNFGISVSIGGSTCGTPVASQDKTQITCQFSSVTVTDIKKPLEVSVTVAATYNAKNSVFYYTLPIATITSSTSTIYETAGLVTITGTSFYNFDLVVSIGGATCNNAVASQDNTQVTCQFSSSVIVTDILAPLEVSISVNSVVTKNSVFYYTLPTPVISSSKSTVYGTPGLVTITGTSFYNFGLVVTIGGSTCSTPMASQDNKEITCQFSSSVTVTDISAPLEISVTIASKYNAKKSVFYYTLATPTIVSSTSTVYKTAGLVTITGTNFYNFGLAVKIGGAVCGTPNVSQDNKEITCQFSSSVTVIDISAPLEISVTINSVEITNSVFYYTLQNPTISSSTQTIFGKPGIITITGSAFYNFDLVVEIGNSPCKSAAASKDSKHITCFFESDVQVVDISTPLEVFVSIDTNFVAKENVFYYAEPTQVLISNSTTTVYGVAGIVTLTGTNFFGQDLVVTIGNSPCSSPVASQDKTQLTCNFNSDVKVLDIQSPLDVFVSVEPDNNITSSIFYYTLPTPTVISSTSTFYGLPTIITIIGTSFYNFDLIVTIGGSSQCTSPVASQDNKQITCKFEADIQISDYNTPLDVSVIIATDYKTNKAVFYYLKPIEVSIFSSTSTKYGVPGMVMIFGNNFINDQLFVQIGGSQCTDAVASQDSKQLTCNFKSDIQVSNFNTALDVFVSIKSLFNATEPVFLYIKSDKNCPVGSNGQMCSGHGTCNPQLNCDCSKEWESSDCSLPNTGG